MKLPAKVVILIILLNLAVHADSTITKKTFKPKKSTIMQDLGYDLKYFAIDWGAFFAAPFSSSKNLIISSSVSYTHLDVYKRQSHRWTGCRSRS